MPEEILKIGIGHLFATGNRLGHDEIFHIAGMRYSESSIPELKDWILKLDPNRKLNGSLRNRLWKQSKVHKNLRKGNPSWKEVEPDIVPFFVDLDVLFLYDRENQKEWFTKIVLKNAERSPICVDLLEMNRFFFPGQELPNSENIIKQYISKEAWRPNDPQLPYLMRSLGSVLQNIVSRIRSESQVAPGKSILYNLLGKALSDKPKNGFQDFDALFQVAGIAHQILWGNELFAKPYGDKAVELIESADVWNELLIREIVATMPPAISKIKKFEKVNLDEISRTLKISSNTLKKYLRKVDSSKTLNRENDKNVIEKEKTYLKLLNALIANEEINVSNLVDSKFVEGTFERLFGKLPKSADKEKTDEHAKTKSSSKGELEGFRRRKEQDAFAEFCIEAINSSGTYAIEAGTGTGKTLGYLAPVCEFVRQMQNRIIDDTLCLMRKHIRQNDSEENENDLIMPTANVKVIIATDKINLQDQLLEKEWPRLTTGKTLYGNLQATPLKGKQNFLCITAVLNLFGDIYDMQNGKSKPMDFKFFDNKLVENRLAWLFLFMILLYNKGMLENISTNLYPKFRNMKQLFDESKSDVACTGDLCQIGNCTEQTHLHKKSLHRFCRSNQCLIGDRLCIYFQHRQKACNADIVVTNHHKLALMDDQIRQSAHVCLIDEADQFPDNLRSAKTIDLSSKKVKNDFLKIIAGPQKRRGFAQIIANDFKKKMGSSNNSIEKREGFKKACENARSILVACDRIESFLKEIHQISYQYPIDTSMRWKDMINRKHPTVDEQIRKYLNNLATEFARIEECWNAILHSGIYVGTLTIGENNEKERIEKYKIFTEQWKEISREIYKNYLSKKFVHVHSREKLEWNLSKIPYDLSDLVKNAIYPTTIFTSATLFVNDSIDLFSDNLCASFNKSQCIASPFNYKDKVRGFLTTSISEYDYDIFRNNPDAKEYWRKQVAGAIIRLTLALNGRTLVLFTNKKEMKNIYDDVKSSLREHGIDPLLQNGSSLAEINTFQSTVESVLFGVDRFWTGVDFPGKTLSQVIVVRTPNPNRSAPLIKHREENMEHDEFWNKYYKPTARLRLKQGFGRLIRSKEDKGLFVVLDQRKSSKSNLNYLRNALHFELWKFSVEPDQMDWFINKGLTHLGLRPEFERNRIDLRNITVPGETDPPPRNRTGRNNQRS